VHKRFGKTLIMKNVFNCTLWAGIIMTFSLAGLQTLVAQDCPTLVPEYEVVTHSKSKLGAPHDPSDPGGYELPGHENDIPRPIYKTKTETAKYEFHSRFEQWFYDSSLTTKDGYSPCINNNPHFVWYLETMDYNSNPGGSAQFTYTYDPNSALQSTQDNSGGITPLSTYAISHFPDFLSDLQRALLEGDTNSTVGGGSIVFTTNHNPDEVSLTLDLANQQVWSSGTVTLNNEDADLPAVWTCTTPSTLEEQIYISYGIWSYTNVIFLSQPYSTYGSGSLTALAKAEIGDSATGIPFQGTWSSGLNNPMVGEYSVTPNEVEVTLRKGAYRMRFIGDAGVLYYLTWSERFTPKDGSGDTLKIVGDFVVGTGEQQYTTSHYVNVPGVEGTVRLEIGEATACVDCITLLSGESATRLASLDFAIPLGMTHDGKSAGSIRLYSQTPTQALATPAALTTELTDSDDIAVVTNGQDGFSEIHAPEVVAVIANIVDPTSYQIALYHPEDFGSNSAHTVWTISNADTNGSTYDRLNIEKAYGGKTFLSQYKASADGLSWKLLTGNGLRYEEKTTVIDGGTGDKDVTSLIGYPSAPGSFDSPTITRKEVRHFVNDTNLGLLLNQVALDPQGDNRVTTYAYYTNQVADGTNYGKLKFIVPDAGSWMKFEYDGEGRITKKITGFQNVPYTDANIETTCRVEEYDYTPIDPADDGSADSITPRTTNVKLQNVLIGTSYAIITPDETREIRCKTPGASYTNSDNLVTVTTRYRTGDEWEIGKVHTVDYPDGTREVHSYSFATPGSEREVTQTVLRGAADPGDPSGVTEGVRTEEVLTDTGHRLVLASYDFDTGAATDIQLSGETNTLLDAFDRPLEIHYMDGTEKVLTYDCCGIESVTNRDGSFAAFTYDDLQRLETETRTLPDDTTITLTHTHDPQGNLLTTTQTDADSMDVLLVDNEYSLADRLTQRTTPQAGLTTFAFAINGSGELASTTTLSDNQSSTRTLYRDGTLKQVHGEASFPRRFEYGVESGQAFSKEIKLDAAYTDTSEWIKTFIDALGRPSSRVFASASDSPTRTWHYNDKGQLDKTVDPEDVTTIYEYDARGRLETTFVDVNGDGQGTKASLDIVTQVKTDVLNDTGLGEDIIRTRTYVWPDDNLDTPRLINTRRVSTDGWRSWSTIWDDTNSVTTSVSGVYNANQKEVTVTTTNADDAITVAVHKYGYLMSSTRTGTDSSQLSDFSYTYNSRGLLEVSTDQRVDTTTSYTYTDANRIDTVSVADSGASIEYNTQYGYDSLGRVTTITKWETGDATTYQVTNEYHPNGLLRKRSGDDVYPAGYGYDAQGRMTSLTNWLNYPSDPQVTKWVRDPHRGWVSSVLYPDKATGQTGTQGLDYTHTKSGQIDIKTLERTSNSVPITVDYGYDTAGRLETVNYSDSTPDVTYTYTRLNQIRTVNRDSAVTTRSYTYAGSLDTETYTNGPLNGLGIDRNYNGILQLQQVAVSGTTVPALDYTYRPGSRPRTISDGQYTATVSYYPNSALVSSIAIDKSSTPALTFGAQYDAFDRRLLTETINPNGSTTFDSIDYGYSTNGIRGKLDELGDEQFDYDAYGQLSEFSHPQPGRSLSYTHDSIGNLRTRQNVDAGAAHTSTFTPNQQNQMASRTVPGFIYASGESTAASTVEVNGESTLRDGDYFFGYAAVDNTNAPLYETVTVISDWGDPVSGSVQQYVPQTPETFSYDADGNLEADGRWTMTWDAENRLTSIESLSNAPAASKRKLIFRYDWLGRRIQKDVYDWNPLAAGYEFSARTKFLYNGWSLLAELDGTDDSLIRQYVWGGGQRLLWLRDEVTLGQSSVHGVSYDGRANVKLLTDITTPGTNLTESAHYEYEPFGTVVRATGPMATANPIRFSSKYQDETGLVYYGYRYYSPVHQKWPNRDPIGIDGGHNLYGFVGGDPVDASDKLGLAEIVHWTEEDNIAAGGYVGVPGPFPYYVGANTAEQALWLVPNIINGAVNSGVYGFTKIREGFVYGIDAADDALGGALGMDGEEAAEFVEVTPIAMPLAAEEGLRRLSLSLETRAAFNAAQREILAAGSAELKIVGEAPSRIVACGRSGKVTSPNATMRANANIRDTYLDPLTGKPVSVSEKLPADHIVPQKWIKEQPGFDKLTPEQQSWLLNHPLNTQGLPGSLNSSKGAKMPGEWQTYKGEPLDPAYISNDAERAQFIKAFIQEQIRKLSSKP